MPSEGEKQAYICWCLNKDIHCMFVEGKSRTVFFPSDTLIYAISRDGSKNYNIRTCEHMILGQLRMGARQTNYAPLTRLIIADCLANVIYMALSTFIQSPWTIVGKRKYLNWSLINTFSNVGKILKKKKSISCQLALGYNFSSELFFQSCSFHAKMSVQPSP